MAKDFFYPGTILSLHRKTAEKLLKADSGDAALLYLCYLAEDNPQSLRWEPSRLEAAQTALIGMGLIDPATPANPDIPQKIEPSGPPDYTQSDITKALEEGFSELVNYVERLLGKALSFSDLKSLYLIRDYLNLPPEVIYLLVSWCVSQTALKYGAGRKPSLHQIQKEAYRWQKAGVNSLEQADAHIARLTEQNERVSQIMEIVEIRGRRPVEGERKYLTAWADMGFADDALRMAFEKTMVGTGKLTWGYMNKILRDWQKQGLYTAAAVEAAEQKRGFLSRDGDSAPNPQSSPHFQDDLALAMQEMQAGKEP